MAFRLQDFECEDCEHLTEFLLDSKVENEEETLVCEECGSGNLKRKLTVGSGKGGHLSWSTWNT